jgi:hypothetical protein
MFDPLLSDPTYLRTLGDAELLDVIDRFDRIVSAAAEAEEISWVAAAEWRHRRSAARRSASASVNHATATATKTARRSRRRTAHAKAKRRRRRKRR